MAFQKKHLLMIFRGCDPKLSDARRNFRRFRPKKGRRLEGRCGRASNHEVIVKGSEGVKYG